jgi:hypothetical protein
MNRIRIAWGDSSVYRRISRLRRGLLDQIWRQTFFEEHGETEDVGTGRQLAFGVTLTIARRCR